MLSLSDFHYSGQTMLFLLRANAKHVYEWVPLHYSPINIFTCLLEYCRDWNIQHSAYSFKDRLLLQVWGVKRWTLQARCVL